MAQVVECLLVKLEALIKTQYCEKIREKRFCGFLYRGLDIFN
jgi:hypothetical protein